MVVVRDPFRRCLIECDLVGDYEVISVFYGGFIVAHFCTDCRCSVEDYEVFFCGKMSSMERWEKLHACGACP